MCGGTILVHSLPCIEISQELQDLQKKVSDITFSICSSNFIWILFIFIVAPCIF